jgi:hypothetical protein
MEQAPYAGTEPKRFPSWAATRAGEWPWWMRTKFGQWLARNFHTYAILWHRETLLAEYREAEALEKVAADVLLRGLLDGPERVDVITWVRWRNARERLERALSDLDEKWSPH